MGWQAILWMAASVGLVLVLPPVIRTTLGLIRRLTDYDAGDIVIPVGVHIGHLVLYGAGWFILGSAIWCLVAAFGAEPMTVGVPALLVMLVASYLVGLLALMVPAGIGVAEVGLVYGFLRFCDAQQAVFGAASLRLGNIATTARSLLIVLGVTRWLRRQA